LQNLPSFKFSFEHPPAMGLVDEVKSGQNTIYAQWAALITFPILLACGITSFGVVPLGI
jgi:hypothetical protein